MVVIVEDAVWLPWLPPLSFEIDTRMVEDTIAVDVGKDKRLCHIMGWKEEHVRHENGLNVQEFNGMDSRHREGSWLLVRVMKLVEVFVQERIVVQPMMPVGQIILPDEDNWELEEEPDPSIIGNVIVESGPASIVDVAREHTRYNGTQKQ